MGLHFRDILMVLILNDLGMAKMFVLVCVCMCKMQIMEVTLELGQKNLSTKLRLL